ncbi:hypothetical protein L204_105586 [Cryptococcus depauperatus]
MPKASASSSQPANSSSSPRPPPRRHAAEMSATPSLPSYPQASDNWQRFSAGLDGCSAVEAFKQCSTWLASNFCPTKRTPQTCKRKLNEMHDAFSKADDYRNGTGEGDGQYQINKAREDDERTRIKESVDNHCQRLCPGFFRLGLDYKEGGFGQRCYRGDSTLSANPAFTGFEQGLHARKAQRYAAFTGETTPVAPENEETKVMDEL